LPLPRRQRFLGRKPREPWRGSVLMFLLVFGVGGRRAEGGSVGERATEEKEREEREGEREERGRERGKVEQRSKERSQGKRSTAAFDFFSFSLSVAQRQGRETSSECLWELERSDFHHILEGERDSKKEREMAGARAPPLSTVSRRLIQSISRTSSL